MTNKTDLELYFEYKCWQGLKERKLADKPKYVERLKYEIGVIEQMKFPGYFLIVADFIDWAKKNDILVGGGRGCLTGNALIITHNNGLKPLKDIGVGDKVISAKGNIKPVTNTFVYDINEELVNIKTWYGDTNGITMTLDHKVYAQKLKRPKGWDNWSLKTKKSKAAYLNPTHTISEIAAQDLEVGDLVWIPFIRNEKDQNLKFNFKHLRDKDLVLNELVVDTETAIDEGKRKNKHLGSLFLRSRANNKIFTFDDGYFVRIREVKRFFNKTKVYDITVEDDHSYVTTCGAVHNSAAGSLVAYALKITNGIDPLEHGLLFERFLNPSRISMPDIDVDFEKEKRDQVIQYISKTYGRDCVCQIGTIGTMKAKMTIQKICKALGYPIATGEELKKLCLPSVHGKPQPLSVSIEQVKELGEYAKAPGAEGKILRWSEKFENRVASVGVHASGLVISDAPVTKHLPLYVAKNESLATQWDMKIVEEVGLIKFDILGLATLSKMRLCLDLIQARHGRVIDIDSIDTQDVDTYRFLHNGELLGIFQLETSQGMRDLVMQIKPENIQDLTAAVAIFRPGPLQSEGLKDYLAWRGGADPKYLIPELEPILRETGGFCVFQDEVIATPNGSVIMKDLKNEDDIINGSGQVDKVKKILHTGNKQVYRYRSDGLIDTRLTSDHKVLTIEGYVPASKASHMLRRRFCSKQRCIQEISTDEGWLLGMLIGDGCLNSSSPVITVASKEKADQIGDILVRLFGGTARKYFATRCWYVGVKRAEGQYHNQFNTWLRKFSLMRSSGKNKTLPINVTSWTDNELSYLLAGLWDSNGQINKETISYCSANPKLLGQLGEILDILRVTFYFADPQHIVIRDRELFIRLIGPFLKFKNFQNTTSTIAAGLCISASFFRTLVDKYRGNTPIKTFCQKRGIPSHLYWTQQDKFLTTVFRHFPEEKEYLLNTFVRGDFAIERVRKIQNLGVQPVYDLETYSEHHSFIAGNAIVHNCVFQEQIMQIAQQCAGYSMAEADLLRKAMGKKKTDILNAEKERFKTGWLKNKLPLDKFEILWAQLLGFADYAFNRAHAASYAFLSYQTAWLKTHYPVEFMTACMINDFDDPEQMVRYLGECARMGLKVLPPDINQSQENFTIIDEHTVRFGLVPIRNIGKKPTHEILTKRLQMPHGYQSLPHFCESVHLGKVNRLKIESLIKAGVFDSFGFSRASLLDWVERYWAYRKEFETYTQKLNTWQKRNDAFQKRELDIANGSKLKALKQWDLPIEPEKPALLHLEELPTLQLQKDEHAHLGMFVSGHPLERLQTNTFDNIALALDLPSGSQVTILGVIVELKEHVVAKSKKKMAFLMLEDLTGRIKATVFPAAFSKVEHSLQPLTPLLFYAKTDIFETDEGVKMGNLIIQNVEPVDLSVITNNASAYKLNIPVSAIDKLLQIEGLFDKCGKHKMLLEVQYASGMQSRLLTPIPTTKNKGELKKILDMIP